MSAMLLENVPGACDLEPEAWGDLLYEAFHIATQGTRLERWYGLIADEDDEWHALADRAR